LRARNALARGDADAALAHANAALAGRPDAVAALALRGRALYAYESWLVQKSTPPWEPDDSEEVVEDETAAAPEISDADDDRPVLTDAERARIYRDAAASFARAEELQPLERSHGMGRARALAEVGDAAGAHRQFATAIGLDLYEGFPWAAYGDFLAEHEEFPRALRIYQLGHAVADGGYCGEQWQSLQEDLHPEDAAE
jgi:tetratricopeptide (TPR) repeat protein